LTDIVTEKSAGAASGDGKTKKTTISVVEGSVTDFQVVQLHCWAF